MASHGFVGILELTFHSLATIIACDRSSSAKPGSYIGTGKRNILIVNLVIDSLQASKERRESGNF